MYRQPANLYVDGDTLLSREGTTQHDLLASAATILSMLSERFWSVMTLCQPVTSFFVTCYLPSHLMKSYCVLIVWVLQYSQCTTIKLIRNMVTFSLAIVATELEVWNPPHFCSFWSSEMLYNASGIPCICPGVLVCLIKCEFHISLVSSAEVLSVKSSNCNSVT